MDEYEIEKLAKQAERHKAFVSDDEALAIDGIPRKIRNATDEYDVERQVKKLERIANENDDMALKNITRKMRHEL